MWPSSPQMTIPSPSPDLLNDPLFVIGPAAPITGNVVVTATALRTAHGIVQGFATVNGQPVAYVRQRATFFHEADGCLTRHGKRHERVRKEDRVTQRKYGQIRRHLGTVFHDLARRKECQIEPALLNMNRRSLSMVRPLCCDGGDAAC